MFCFRPNIVFFVLIFQQCNAKLLLLSVYGYFRFRVNLAPGFLEVFRLNKCEIARDTLVPPDFHQELRADDVNCSHSVKSDFFHSESKRKCFSCYALD